MKCLQINPVTFQRAVIQTTASVRWRSLKDDKNCDAADLPPLCQRRQAAVCGLLWKNQILGGSILWKKQFVSFWLRQLPWQLSSPDAPDPVAAEKFENFFKKWRTFDFVLRIMIVEGILWTSVFTDFYRQPAVTGATASSLIASGVTDAPVFSCL